MTSGEQRIDLDRLLKLRLVVARYGEMDIARWWNTQGLLGRRGAVVLKRGFPTTHPFVQARVVFAVAQSRCHELFDPPGCMTLWSLPAEL
ncbi:MAG: BrxE family protein [Candidatus Binatia bacterium]